MSQRFKHTSDIEAWAVCHQGVIYRDEVLGELPLIFFAEEEATVEAEQIEDGYVLEIVIKPKEEGR